jgi:glycosyltransferase involved in cell wall biosynthesis
MGRNGCLISVVIPTYNRSHLILGAVDSVLKQTLQDFEVVIVDDGSSDGTWSVLDEIEDAKVRVIKHSRNLGGAAARNSGIKVSKGKFIAFLDSDDRWMPEKLAKQAALAERENDTTGIIFCGTAVVNEQGEHIRFDGKGLTGESKLDIMYKNVIGSTSVAFVRRECFEKCGLFDESLPACQDWDMWIRIGSVYDFVSVGDVLVKYLVHENRITTNYRSKLTGHSILLKKHYLEFAKSRRSHAEQVFRIGKFSALCGRKMEAIGNFLKAIQINPYQYRYYMHLLAVAANSSVYRIQHNK